MTPVTLGHKLGVETTAMIRARAGISYALTEAMDEAHCGLPTAELAQLAEEILRFRGLWSRRRSTSNWLRARSSLTACAKQTEIFLAGLHRAERVIAERILRLANGTLPWVWIDPEKAPVMQDVRGQRRAAPASCARLQSRQFPAHAGDARGGGG